MDNAEALLAWLGLKFTKGGAAVSVLGWVISSDAAATIGAAVAVFGLLLNFIFNFRRDRREHREHEARMRSLGE